MSYTPSYTHAWLKHTSLHLSVLALLGLTSNAYAAALPTHATTGEIQNTQVDLQKTFENIQEKKELQATEQQLQERASNEVLNTQAKNTPADSTITTDNKENADNKVVVMDASWSTEQVYAELEKNPEAFEQLLLRAIAQADAEILKLLIPAYAQYPNKDPSMVEWGNALIALEKGDTKTAVDLLRKINAALPNIRLLRIQMASALYQNKQTSAAKDELQKLLREDLSTKDREQITSYINAIDRLDKWSYSFNLSFVKDNNLDNAPPVGTKISNDSQSLSYNTPHEAGTGFTYQVGADKKWSFDNNMFSTASVGLGGTYYWDNKKYNDIYLSASAGVGYQGNTWQAEISPTVVRNWYGGGQSGDNEPKPYTLSQGVRVSGSKWLSPNLMYQANLQYNNVSYEKPYQNNDGKIYSMTNGILYAPSAQRYYSVHWNLSKKDGTKPSSSYERSGVTVGWNNTWSKGITTLATLGLASKLYQGVDFANIQKHNYELSAGLSIWKRDFSIFGLTPRLNLNVSETQSNSPFEETSDKSATIVLTKTF